MKLSKTLLSAILIGVAVQTTTSCKKDKDNLSGKPKQEKKKDGRSNPVQSCPACGMG